MSHRNNLRVKNFFNQKICSNCNLQPKYFTYDSYYTYYVMSCWCGCDSESIFCEKCVKEHSTRKIKILTNNCWMCQSVICKNK